MLKIDKFKNTKASILKNKSQAVLQSYKSKLLAESKGNRDFVIEHKGDTLSAWLESKDNFLVISKFRFYQNEEKVDALLSRLRYTSVEYLLLKREDFADKLASSSDFSWIVKHSGDNLLLITKVKHDRAYRELLVLLMQFEAASSLSIFNRFEVLFTKESSIFISFIAGNSELRKLYDLRNTKEAILLETLSTLNNQIREVAHVVDNEINSLASLYPANFLFSFPFKA